MKNPPIRELVIDIRAVTSKKFGVNSFESIHEKIANDYPNKKEISAFSGEFNIADPARMKQSSAVLGYVFSTEDKKNLIQCRTNGFTVNRIGNYQETSFSNELEKVKKYWAMYRDVAKPTAIDRIAVRVINDLPLPLGSDTADYLKILPPFPDSGRVTQIEGFFNRQKFLWNDEIKVNFIFAYEGKITDKFVTMIMDIDLYKELPNSIEEEEMWKTFHSLNDGKNQIFLSSLTDKGQGLFV